MHALKLSGVLRLRFRPEVGPLCVWQQEGHAVLAVYLTGVVVGRSIRTVKLGSHQDEPWLPLQPQAGGSTTV